MVRLKIYFSGSAPFEHKLSLNGSNIPVESTNVRLVDFDNHVLITIPELHSYETGRYEYTVSNESGEASIGFWINVTGLPSAPEGPLVISNVDQHQVDCVFESRFIKLLRPQYPGRCRQMMEVPELPTTCWRSEIPRETNGSSWPLLLESFLSSHPTCSLTMNVSIVYGYA